SIRLIAEYRAERPVELSCSPAGRSCRGCRCVPPTSPPTRPCWGREVSDDDGEQEHGAAEAPPQGLEAADAVERVGEGGGALCGGQRRSSDVPAAAVRAGAHRARAEGGRAAAEGGAVPDRQAARRV